MRDIYFLYLKLQDAFSHTSWMSNFRSSPTSTDQSSIKSGISHLVTAAATSDNSKLCVWMSEWTFVTSQQCDCFNTKIISCFHSTIKYRRNSCQSQHLLRCLIYLQFYVFSLVLKWKVCRLRSPTATHPPPRWQTPPCFLGDGSQFPAGLAGDLCDWLLFLSHCWPIPNPNFLFSEITFSVRACASWVQSANLLKTFLHFVFLKIELHKSLKWLGSGDMSGLQQLLYHWIHRLHEDNSSVCARWLPVKTYRLKTVLPLLDLVLSGFVNLLNSVIKKRLWMRPVFAGVAIVPQVWQKGSCDMNSLGNGQRLLCASAVSYVLVKP